MSPRPRTRLAARPPSTPTGAAPRRPRLGLAARASRSGALAFALALALALALGVALPAPARARDLVLAPGGEPRLRLGTSLKSTLLLSHAPDDPDLYPERDAATSFWRLRVEPEARPAAWLLVDAAYEQRVLVAPSANPPGGPLLPPSGAAPWRLRPVEGAVAGGASLQWRHELDRAFVALKLPRVDATLGRQAVGWGRGVLFTAVDVFAPFSPLEIDREWRRGIDAARADVRLTDAVSFDAVAAGDGSASGSVLAARLRGARRGFDAELLGGRRARDLFAGATASAVLGQAEVHGEAALFRVPDALPDAPLADARLVPKAVAGASYDFAVGRGLTVWGEYHYTGFGAASASALAARLADPDYRVRLVRGDEQIVERHAVAVLASLPFGDVGSAASLQWLHAPADGSGLLAPSLSWDMATGATLLAGVYLPYGARPEGLVLHSAYGSSALTAFVQIRLYD